eukprot:TRINITY_DN27980_c0_g1_i1.p1 TRINITY_DN27980_c0_g1~~TRINITY_DN27980_c0_g1_i1.p1  ORF type:complete len:383 (+),score=50.91 TRINITY_DN27980_c0_g1_i1:99-1247(+)
MDSAATPACAIPLLVSVAVSWVAVAQFARAAEQSTERLQHASAVPLITWTNSTGWMLLAGPYAWKRWRAKKAEAEAAGTGRCEARPTLCALLKTDAFTPRQAGRFLAVAMTTNLSYIAALHYLPASLNTATFCSSPVFTLLLTLAWLPEVPAGSEGDAEGGFVAKTMSCVSDIRTLAVMLSVLGVLLISEPWRSSSATNSLLGRATGLGFALLAALLTSIYQVTFKSVFGDSLGPEEVGLFLATMGLFSCIFCGLGLAALVGSDLYAVDVENLPWGLVAVTACSSLVFNFLIKFGLSRQSPVAVSIATQLGVPLNLLLDTCVLGVHLDWEQVAGCFLMLASFSAFVFQGHRASRKRAAAREPGGCESSRPGLSEPLIAPDCS